jgi:hypothetical protein
LSKLNHNFSFDLARELSDSTSYFLNWTRIPEPSVLPYMMPSSKPYLISVTNTSEPTAERQTTLWRVLLASIKPLSDSTGLPLRCQVACVHQQINSASP